MSVLPCDSVNNIGSARIQSLQMHSLHSAVSILLATVSFIQTGVAAQCTGTEHPNCQNWVRNGFCQNTAYSMEQKMKYCGQRCGLCNGGGGGAGGGAGGGGAGSPPTGCFDRNANCAKWQAENQFCSRPDTPIAKKLQYCCLTCSPYIYTTTTSTTTSTPLTTASTPTTTTSTPTTTTSAPATTTSTNKGNPECTDKDETCASLNAANGFCSRSDFPDSFKTQYCCATCLPFINATTSSPTTTTPETTTAPTTSLAYTSPPPTTTIPGSGCSASLIVIISTGGGSHTFACDSSGDCAVRTLTCKGEGAMIKINNEHRVIADGDDGHLDRAARLRVTCVRHTDGMVWMYEGVRITRIECVSGV